MIRLLSYAYEVPVNPSSGLSALRDWTIWERYDIEAKAPANFGFDVLKSAGQIQRMIRGLAWSSFSMTWEFDADSDRYLRSEGGITP